MFRPLDRPRPTAGGLRFGRFPFAGALIAVGIGCSGDDEAATTAAPASTTSSAPQSASASDVDPQFAERCELAVEVDEQDGPPTAAQLHEYTDLAPEELGPAVERLALAPAAAGDEIGAVFSSPEAVAALEQVTDFEATSCGLGSAQDASVNELDPDATAELQPGDRVLVCPTPDAEGPPHFELGMVHDFTVASCVSA